MKKVKLAFIAAAVIIVLIIPGCGKGKNADTGQIAAGENNDKEAGI